MLNDCEYKEIMKQQVILEGTIAGLERDEAKYEKMREAAQTEKECVQNATSLYTNYLHDAIVEYEEAHPPVEPE